MGDDMATLQRINQDDLRNHNLSVVLNQVLRSPQPLSRADLAKATGLTKATMSLLVSLLIEHGVLREGVPLVQAVYGRPSTPLIIAGGRVCGIGIQINTDGYGYTVLDLDGSTVAERWVDRDLHEVDADEIFADLDAMLLDQEQTLREQGYILAGTGIALPGLVTEDAHLIVARNLGWENIDLMQYDVIKRLNVVAGNESNMAATAHLPGYATQVHDEGMVGPDGSFIYVSTDIGIGGAIVRDGKVVDGGHGFAGEIGHLSVQLDGPQCRCGRHGCLEVYAGRRSMVERAGLASGDAAASQQAIDMFTQAVFDGAEPMHNVYLKAFGAMVSAIVSTINLSDVDTVIIGGCWAQLSAEERERMQAEVQRQILARDKVEAHILLTRDMRRPALIGAAQIGLRKFVDNPLAYLTADSVA